MSKKINKSKNESQRGIRIRILEIILIILVVIVAFLMLYVSNASIDRYKELMSANELYLRSQLDAAYLQEGSDFLTDQVRAFVVTGDTTYVDGYFSEVNETRKRESAVEDMEKYLKDTEVYSYLKEALDLSNELMLLEMYAMRIEIRRRGYDPADFPEQISSVELDPVYETMSETNLQRRAENLVFGDSYKAYKTEIKNKTDMCAARLIEMTGDNVTDSAGSMQSHLFLQLVLLVLLVAITLIIGVVTSLLLILPLEKSIPLVLRQQTLPLRGAQELRIFTGAYNKAVINSKNTQEKLTYDATHDALTDLLNRSEFEKMREIHEKRKSALMLIDVDYFKTINDSYGHDVGDAVLKKVAATLKNAFRTEDFVFRVGGDEFAVIMVHTSWEHKALIESKIKGCNAVLNHPADGVPPVTLSVGIAFKDTGRDDQDMFKDADRALYVVKERGRNGYAFFTEDAGHEQEA